MYLSRNVLTSVKGHFFLDSMPIDREIPAFSASLREITHEKAVLTS